MTIKNDQIPLELRIKRVRTRLAASVKTGSGIASICGSRTDPTENGRACLTLGGGPGCSATFKTACC